MAKRITAQEVNTIHEHKTSKFTEYPFDTSMISLGISEINGRYPDTGYDLDGAIEQIWYVLEGKGTVQIKDSVLLELNKDDMVHILQGEAYVISGQLKLVVASSPAWRTEQHKHIE